MAATWVLLGLFVVVGPGWVALVEEITSVEFEDEACVESRSSKSKYFWRMGVTNAAAEGAKYTIHQCGAGGSNRIRDIG